MEKKIGNSFENLLKKFPGEYKELIDLVGDDRIKGLEEIRIKAGSNVILIGSFGEIDTGVYVSVKGIVLIMEKLLDYSVYAHMEDLCKGYITVEGGHRVGISGRAVMEKGEIKTLKDISSLNIRRSRAITGCSESLKKYIIDDNRKFLNTLIVSPPKCGKTTLLRDAVRMLSNMGMRISLIDERSEIAAMYKGISQHDVGLRTDVLDGCKKSEGIIMMIRSMSPEIVCTDEIGSSEDARAVEEAVTAGVGILTTVHGNSWEELKISKIGSLIENRIFERYIFMSGKPKVGTIVKILDREGRYIGN